MVKMSRFATHISHQLEPEVPLSTTLSRLLAGRQRAKWKQRNGRERIFIEICRSFA